MRNFSEPGRFSPRHAYLDFSFISVPQLSQVHRSIIYWQTKLEQAGFSPKLEIFTKGMENASTSLITIIFLFSSSSLLVLQPLRLLPACAGRAGFRGETQAHNTGSTAELHARPQPALHHRLDLGGTAPPHCRNDKLC